MTLNIAAGRKTALSLIVSGAALALLTIAPAHVQANSIINNFGLASPAVTITFSEIVFANGTPLTNEYAGLGVTFSPVAYYDPQPGFFPTQSIGNFDFVNQSNTVSLLFNGPVTQAALAVLTNAGNSTTFTALLGGVPVESFSAPTDTSPTNFFGFDSILFDEIQISNAPQNGAFLFDNLQLGAVTAVPEPGVVAFGILAGGSVLGLIARKRKA